MKYHWQNQEVQKTVPRVTAKVARQKEVLNLVWQAYQGLIITSFILWLLNN